jgi:hypothetical protein
MTKPRDPIYPIAIQGAYQNKCNSEGDIDVLKVDGF